MACWLAPPLSCIWRPEFPFSPIRPSRWVVPIIEMIEMRDDIGPDAAPRFFGYWLRAVFGEPKRPQFIEKIMAALEVASPCLDLSGAPLVGLPTNRHVMVSRSRRAPSTRRRHDGVGMPPHSGAMQRAPR